ncbi:N-acetylneuraminate lyase-like [Engraulis encrasicolus]|uniref:N-acetylneuraminate lyase-like n=1 Tax=Engraulis encrasicolus TaxID=184585 RepID=UPI002FCFC8B0
MAKLGKKLTGLVAATFTPLTSEGEINLPVIEPYVDYLVSKQGVRKVFVNGTTGESVSLSLDERKRLVEEWCQKGKDKLEAVIVHVGCSSLKDCKELARHAVEVEAHGIALISPSFFKPPNAAALRTFLQEVASAAPSLPFYYYHIPSMTGLHLRASEVMEGIKEMIPSFSGVKFSGSDLLDFGQCVHSYPGHWSYLYGMDEQLLAALALGADGAVGSTYNYMGSHMNNVLAASDSGNLPQARTHQFQMQEIILFAMKNGFGLAMNKKIMSDLSGLALGPPRLPLVCCDEAKAHTVVQKLRSVLGDQ